MANYIEPPKDLPLSTKVKGLLKAYDTAVENLNKYRQENARYASKRTLNALDQYVYQIPALREAEKELREQEIEAAANGRPLPDRSKVLRPIEAKVDEYKRMVPALEALVTRARNEYVEGVKAELVPMGLKEAQKAAKHRDEYEAAWQAMQAARASLERHAGLFTWCVSEGDMETVPRHGHSQGDNLEYWELDENGRLTWEASQGMDFLEWVVKVPGLIEPDPNPPVVEEVNGNPNPQYFNAKSEGYANWEH
ncbi:hypothetical protein ACPCTK_25750 [Streptomyces pseudogriseolus]|uniref:hypothetical protein n=1 Tax=Streptomyces pseudogriseolus TaxID=36817 RepID=UPI003FA29FC4